MKQLTRFALVFALVAVAAAAPCAAWGQPPAAGQTAHVNNMDMYYQVRGAGEPLVLLHPWGACGAIWDPFADSLAAKYRLIIIDQRGHGRSTNPDRTFTHRQSARDVLALLDQLGVKRFKAMGMSSGAMTLLHIATQQPERIEAMVLIGGTSSFPEQARAVMRRSSSIDSLPPDVREGYLHCASRGADQARELIAQFSGFKDSYDDMNFTAPYLGTIKARTLIVHGDRDFFFPVSIPVAMYDAIPRSALWIVPNGGHIPVFGPRAREFMDVALAFLHGDGGARP
jgi:pimeloyl-ACP methyl ester carboxylesterase